ncbi:alpha-L-arabinofuranosidase [Chitinophaga filiformis]|uniref:alpha-L-arabinofuranosidase C-terminal domain-containing protein n=1 Tax=Chitinophaga filiformis TaxID=104663 RepID=UPI001F2DA63C|nr:alpha-L-arabinofuranosidase C-terminal domain-containing protein [Chitinophaga filiformis]MCF6403056.1 alpha-L-arabinofuranosidase [Chitinophaga filiformis]
MIKHWSFLLIMVCLATQPVVAGSYVNRSIHVTHADDLTHAAYAPVSSHVTHADHLIHAAHATDAGHNTHMNHITHPTYTPKAPDSVYLFSYTTSKNNERGGLQFAWSQDKQQWHMIGNGFAFLYSDYGRWGADKRMNSPWLIQGPDGIWHCIWSLNERDRLFAHAASADLVNWKRQSYPDIAAGRNFLRPAVQYDAAQRSYTITYTDADGKQFQTTTTDFKTYRPATQISAPHYADAGVTISLSEGTVTGQVHRVAWDVVDRLIKTRELAQYKWRQQSESSKQDAERFGMLQQPLQASITLQPEKAKPISNLLLGIFFEDINYAADGGLYAELVQNRDFEYALSDKDGRDPNWNSYHSWTLRGENSTFTVDATTPLHPNNPHYAVLDTKTPGAALVNSGYDGIPVKKGDKYDLSLFSNQLDGKSGKVLVRLVSPGSPNNILAQTTITISGNSWKKAQTVLTATASADSALLELQPLTAGRLALDMVSLFPQQTFKGRKNGLREDLAQVVADIHPRFVRFPGGCVAHGDGLNNIYRWKNTIGPLEARKPQRNLWGYHQSAGLGYFEYFRFCEDIGAEPVPVVAAGVPCQNSGPSDKGSGQQGGIPMNEMDEYVQDILDLIEYANGDIHTTWGKKRAEAGHPQPFHLKYVGIGNEDLITDIFEERFTLLFNAVKKKYPEITVIGTAGPFFEGTDYEEGWDIANKLKVPMIDEHYYVSPGWFINNQDYYDKYDRSRSKVYLGEYAAHLPGRPSNIETALAEALYLTALERNGDIVSMASYAPLLAREKHTQWTPDLIYFNNTTVKPTVNYYVQQLYGTNAGDVYLPGTITISNGEGKAVNTDGVKERVAVSVVKDTKSNSVIIKLVNLLPKSVQSGIDLSGIDIADSTAIKTVLQGSPDSKDARPVVSNYPVAAKFNTELPAYSFTVIRIKTK